MNNKSNNQSNKTVMVIIGVVIAAICIAVISIMTYLKNSDSQSLAANPDILFVEEEPDVDALAIGWGDNVGGRKMYTKAQIYNENALGNTVTFNSMTDNVERGGDERNFVIAKKDKGFDPSKDLWSSDIIDVSEEEVYTIAMYVHNDNPNGMNAIAEDVVAHVTLPLEAGKTLGVQCSIDSSNAVPTRYWDGVNFKSDRDFVLEYIEGSAVVKNNGIGKDSGYTISDNLITSYGVPLGYEQLDGRIPGGSEYELYVEFKVQPVFVK